MTIVAAPQEMDNATFSRHMGLRHADSMGGLTDLQLGRYSNGLADSWRAFHDRLHRLRLDLDHEHEDEGRKSA
jgi:hypothetical protein